MLLLDSCHIPQAEFACLSLLMDSSSLNLEPFLELASVSSPLANTAPVIIRSCLVELHEYLNSKLSKQTTVLVKGQSDMDRNGDDTNGTVPLNGFPNADVEQEISQEKSKTSDAQSTVNDNEHVPVPFAYSDDSPVWFHKLCMEEDKLFDIHPFHDGSRCDTYRSKNGVTLEYILIKDAAIVQTCLSRMLNLAKGSNRNRLPIHGIIIVIGVKGPVHQIPYYSAIDEMKQRLTKFASTFRMINFSETAHTRNLKGDVELMLLSLIMDQDSLKTNEQFYAEYGNDFDVETDEFLNRKSNKPKLFPKKFTFKDKRRRRKHESAAEEDISKNIISTALVSSSAPSSEIARIISDQMKALSLAETDMNIKGYSRASKRSFGGKTDRMPILIKSPSRGSRRLARDLVGFEYSARLSQHFNPTPYESSSINGKISHVSDVTSVTATTMSTDSSVASYIPTLSGPSRDSSTNKKYFRRNKVISASLINKQLNMEKGFDPFAVEEATTSRVNVLGNVISGDQESMSVAASNTVDSTVSLDSPAMRALPEAKIDGDSSLKTISKTAYIPGSRKLFITLALNEDLSCTYAGNKLTHCAVQGIIQVLMKSESTAFVPFLCRMFDSETHIESIEHNEKYANNISHERASGDEWSHQFVVTLPKADNYYPVLKYLCSKKVVPVPLRVQQKIRTNQLTCRVALQVTSNPSNEKKLTELTILMSVPDNVIGESLTTQPEGGIWNSKKRSVMWCVKELGEGEKFVLQAQFLLNKTVEEYGSPPKFPVTVRCQSMSAQLSKVVLDCSDANGFPGDIKTKVARRFRISQREQEE